MNWKGVLVVEEMRDRLASRSRLLAEETGICEKGGLSLSQVHQLVDAMNQRRSMSSVSEYIREAIARSRPKDLTRAERGKGEAWTLTCPASETGGWQFFGEKLQQEVNEIYVAALATARRLAVEDGQQQATAMACLRVFAGYIVWSYVARRSHLAVPVVRGTGE